MAHRDGTYLQSFRQRGGGTCGPLPDQVVILDADAMTADSGAPLDCALDAPDGLSADQCKVTRAYTCSTDDGMVSIVAISEEHDGGARLTGTVTATAFDADGSISCRSTYAVSFVRQ